MQIFKKWFKFQGTALDMFTPTSVLRKMHSDKVAEKEKQTHGGKLENEPGNNLYFLNLLMLT